MLAYQGYEKRLKLGYSDALPPVGLDLILISCNDEALTVGQCVNQAHSPRWVKEKECS